MSHSLFCVLGDPVLTLCLQYLHRHGNVQCTEASACFVDLDGGHRSQRRHGDPYQPGADGFWFWFWERAVIGGRGGTRRTTGLKHTGPIDGRRRRGWNPGTVCLSGPGRELRRWHVCFWKVSSHLSKSHATCEPGPSERRRGWWSKRHGQPSRVDFKGLVRGRLVPFLAQRSGPSCVMRPCFRVQAERRLWLLLIVDGG